MADLFLYNNLLEHAIALERLQYRRRSASLRNQEVAFEMPDDEFVGLYRLTKPVTLDLIHEVEPYLPGSRGGISAVTKVLTALAFYASGSYQRVIGASVHNKMHQVSVSNCLRAVSVALNAPHFRQKYIKFPLTRGERNIIKQGFYNKFGMPGVIGCVDGTHIAIVRPVQNEERYFNRKRYHSLNCQIICDSNLNILSVDASFGGSNHDAYVWNQHPLKPYLESLDESVWLLGDSGYALRPTLLTPIVSTEPGTPQRLYTNMHVRARNTVERCIGVLKSRWRCLLVDRKLHYHPTTAGYITNACVVLHNIANAARVPDAHLTPEEEQNEISLQTRETHRDVEPQSLAAGEQVRDSLIERLWAARM